MSAQFAWFHSPPIVGLLIYAGNALAAIVGATLVNLVCGRRARLETIGEVLAFVVLGAGVAPLVSATVGSATLSWFGVESQTFTSVWPLFWIGDATGMLLVAPVVLFAVQYWRERLHLSAAQRIEAFILGVIFLTVAALSLTDDYLPTPYIIMPPLLWVAVRFELRGAAVALTLLALITLALTVTGASQFIGDPESQRERQVMLQLFLVISALSALIVAAISRQHQQATLALHGSVDALGEREQELSQLVNMVPSHVWRLTPQGEPIFFNQRMVDFLGTTVDGLDRPGTSRLEALAEFVNPDDATAFKQGLRTCVGNGENFVMRYRLRRSDGEYRWMSSRGEPLRDQQGNIVQWYGICHDIDDQVKAEDARRRNELELRQLIDTVPVQIWCVTPGGDPAYINKTMADYIGLKLDDFDSEGGLPSAIKTIVHPDDRDVLFGALSHSFATGKPFEAKFRNRRWDGVYRWTEGHAAPLRDETGRIIRWYGANVDIDEMLTTQQALLEREAKIRRLVDSDIIGIVIWDLDGTVIDANDAFLRMVQYTRDDVAAGLRWFDITPPDWQVVHAQEEAAELAATGKMQAREKEYFRKDGSRVPVLIGAACFEGQSRQGVAYILDLTELKRAEAALSNSKRQLEQMIDAVPFSILSFDPSGKMTYASKRYLEQAGSPEASVKDFNAFARDVSHPDDFQAMFQRARDGFATEQPFVNRFRSRLKDGRYRWIEARAQPLRGEDGAIVQWYFASIDIEDEMKAQEALRERERFLWQLVETLPAMIDCAAPDGEPVFRSQQLREFLGYELEQLDGLGKSRLAGTLDAGVHPDDVSGVKEQYARCLGTGEPYARRHRLRRFDGEYRWVETRAAPMRSSDGTIIQWNVICLDIDGEVRAQEALRLAQERLARASQAASLAELSASIAHEVNQPLAAIVANSHACHRWLSAAPPNLERAKVAAERIIRDANSAADVVGRIRALFRQSSESRSSAAIATVMAEARDLMAEEALRRRVRVHVEVEGTLPKVVLDRTQIQQVLVNLMRNGIEAMDGNGTDKLLSLRARRTDHGVQVEVIDSGQGLDDVNKVFDPFFTTKRDGMGMGLAICRSIVEAHGGQLWAEGNQPRGARFIFTLPIDLKAPS
jgi:PAS domain S-box-containing protein